MKKINIIKNEWGDIAYKNENKEFHREDGPAVIYADGHKQYWYEGEFIGYDDDCLHKIVLMSILK